MHYLKRNTKYSILAFLIIVLFITISIFTLTKTEVYFSLYDNPQKEIIKNINQAQAFINIAMYVFPPPAQSETKVININTASPEELTSILQISEFLTQKIIALREALGGFKDPQDLVQLPEITTLEWEEWEEEGIIIIID
jgi:DNA uptake protein ComE-like DNA-binding protein